MKGATKRLSALVQSAKTRLNKKFHKSPNSTKAAEQADPFSFQEWARLALPAELLSIVFSQLDPFTVWMVCRNVSKLWRAEAEVHFKLVLLPQLYFKVRCHLEDVAWQGQNRDLSGWCRTTKLLHFSQVTDRVFFSVRQKYRLHLTSLKYWNSHRDYSDVLIVPTRNLGIKARNTIQTQYKIINRMRTGGPFNGGRPIEPSFLQQRPAPNHILLPGLKVYFDSNKMSFLWKEFLTQFFLAEIRHPKEEGNCGLVLCCKEGCRVTMNKNSKHWDMRRQLCSSEAPKIHSISFGDVENIFGRSVCVSTYGDD